VRSNRQCLDLAVALDDAEDDNLARCTPAPCAFSSATKSGFIAFQLALKRLAQLLGIGAAGTQQTIEALGRRPRGHTPKALAVDRDTQCEPLRQTVPGAIVQAG